MLPKSERLRVAGYVRTSSDEQERQQTHEAQVAWLEEQAAARGWDLTLYVEPGISGETLRARAKMRQLLAHVGTGGFDAVAVRGVDRLCRSQGLSDWATIADTLKAAGVRVVSAGGEYDLCEPTQAFMFTVLGPGVAGFEKSQIVARTEAGRKRVLAKGLKPRGVDPFGLRYDAKAKTWAVVEAEAETVRRVFALAVEGLNTWEIEARLRAEARWSRNGQPISRSAIHRMLRRRTYRGEWQHRLGVVSVPPVVDEETWLRVNGGLDRKPRRQHERWLSGVMTCGRCDLPAHVVAVGKSRTAYVRCASLHPWYRRKGYENCGGSWRLGDVEDAVWRLACRVLSDPSYLAAAAPKRGDDPAAALHAEIEDADTRIAAVEAKLRGATLRWSQGRMPDAAYDTAMGTLGGELALAKERRAEAQRQLGALSVMRAADVDAASTLERYRARLERATTEQRRAVLRALCPRKSHGIVLSGRRLVLRGIAPAEADKLSTPASVNGGAVRLLPFTVSAPLPLPRRRTG